MAKKKAKKRAKPKLKFKAKPADVCEPCAPEIKLAIWGIIALVIIIVLVMYFTGML
jgi:hypothetical protein